MAGGCSGHWPRLLSWRSVAWKRPFFRQRDAVTQIAITRTATPKPTPADETLAFGKVFSDHMFLMNYEDGKGLARPPHRALRRRSLWIPPPASCIMARRSLTA